MALFHLLVFLSFSCCLVHSSRLNVPVCPPPDYPQFGYYGPVKQEYEAGDTIHYFCDVDTYIGGNYLRICQDNGEWNGHAPVCDTPLTFTSVEQTSTAEPEYANEANNARDGYRSTCASTKAGHGQTWTGTLAKPTQVIRVMLYLPRGQVNYDVFAIRDDGSETSCGKANRRIERLEWIFHNCPEPHNTNVVAIRIQTNASHQPLELCEVVAHGLTDPTCVDPKRQVLNGRLMLTRTTATVICNRNYSRDRIFQINCIRNGMWEGMNLMCIDSDIESERVPVDRNPPSNQPSPGGSNWDDDKK